MDTTFSITCTTCSARLRVQNVSAIGQILACPKCQSMVKVEPPEDWQPPDEHHVLDDAGVPRTPPSLVSESTIHRQASAADNAFEDAVDLLAGKSTPANRTEPAARPSPQNSSAAGPKPPARKPQEPKPQQPAGDDKPLLPNSTWTSQSSRKRLLVAGAVAGTLLFCMAAFAIGRALNNNDDQTQPTAASTADSPPAIEQPADPPATDTNRGEPESESDAVDPPHQGIAVDPHDDAEELVANTIDSNTADPSLVEPKPESPDDETASIGPTGPPGLVAKPADETADDEFTPPSLLAELDRFSELIDDPTLAGASAEGDEVADVLTPGEVPEEGPILPRPASRHVNVAARLDDPLQGIQFTDVPLGVFIRFLSDFSTIPISLSPEALTQRQMTPRTPVSIRQTDTTVGQVLHDVLAALGLGYVQQDQQLVVVAVSTESDLPREVEYDLSDLSAGSEEDVKTIAGWITDLIAPKTWRSNGGPGILGVKGTSLIIQQSEAIHFKVLIFCEKLRVARRLLPRSRYPAELLQLDRHATKTSERWENPISMNYLDDVRFVEIIERAEEQSGVDILIDWHALAEAGWNPDAVFPFSVDKKPLRQMLERLMRQMELTYRITDADTVQITTDERLMNLAEIEFYRAGDLVPARMSAEQLVNGVKSTLGEVHFFDHAGAVCFDPKSRYLIVSLPQPQQQAMAGILEGLRE